MILHQCKAVPGQRCLVQWYRCKIISDVINFYGFFAKLSRETWGWPGGIVGNLQSVFNHSSQNEHHHEKPTVCSGLSRAWSWLYLCHIIFVIVLSWKNSTLQKSRVSRIWKYWIKYASDGNSLFNVGETWVHWLPNHQPTLDEEQTCSMAFWYV